MFHVLVQDGITYMCMAEQVGMALSPPPPPQPPPPHPGSRRALLCHKFARRHSLSTSSVEQLHSQGHITTATPTAACSRLAGNNTLLSQQQRKPLSVLAHTT